MKKKFAILSIAALLALGWILGTGTSASAHTPTASLSCSSASVSLVSYDSGATAAVTLDGTSEHTGTFGGHYVQQWPLNPKVDHTLVVHVVSHDGNQYNFDFNQTTTNCAPMKPPKPEPTVVVTTHTTTDCDTTTDTVYTDTTTTDWTYDATSNTWVPATPITVETTTTQPATAEECPVSTPTPTPTSTPPVVIKHHHPPRVPPVVENPNSLAYTGVSTAQAWTYGSLGSALVLFGLGFLLIRKRHERKLA